MSDNERREAIVRRIVADARAIVTDFKVDEDEIHDAARFLNDLGRHGEFADLLDIFLGTASVMAVVGSLGGTRPNLSGPYYKADAPRRPGNKIYDGDLPAGETRLLVRGTIVDDATGEPVRDAVLDVWQADGQGIYDEQGYHLRGQVDVAPDGSYEFETTVPAGYQIPAKGPTTALLEMMGQHNWRPAHIHARVHVGASTPLQTQFFIGGAKYLDSDPVDAVYPDLVVDPVDLPDGSGKTVTFPIRLVMSAARARSSAGGPKTD